MSTFQFLWNCFIIFAPPAPIPEFFSGIGGRYLKKILFFRIPHTRKRYMAQS